MKFNCGVKYFLRKAPRRDRVTRKYLETKQARNEEDKKEGKFKTKRLHTFTVNSMILRNSGEASRQMRVCCDVAVSNYLNSSVCCLWCATVMSGVPLSRLAVSVSVGIKIASGVPCRPCLPTQPSYPSFSLSPIFSFHLFPAASTWRGRQVSKTKSGELEFTERSLVLNAINGMTHTVLESCQEWSGLK